MNKTEKAQLDCELNDYDIASDVLGGHKTLVKLYSTAICECAEEDLRELLKTQFTECACDQFEAFNYMNERGMYKCECAPESGIEQAVDKYCRCEEKMNK